MILEALAIGIFKIHAQQNILFIYEMKQNKISLTLIDFYQKNFMKYHEILLKYCTNFALLFLSFYMPWMKVIKNSGDI